MAATLSSTSFESPDHPALEYHIQQEEKMNTEASTTSQHTKHPVPGCMMCEQMFAEDIKLVLDSDEFRCYVTPVYPWAVMVLAKRHECDGPWSLSEAEAVDLGKLIPKLTDAIRKMGNERVYVLAFGEDIPMPHFHMGIFSRWVEISEAAHEVLYSRVQKYAPDPLQVAGNFATDVRAQLS